MYNPLRCSIMKKIFLAAISIFFLCSCTKSGTADIKISVKEYETDISSARIESFTLSGLKNSEFESEINRNVARDADGAAVSFDTIVSESTEKIRMGNKCVLEISQLIRNNSDDFISILEEHYVYAGGAHGSTIRYPRNIDTLSGKTVQLSDLFADESFKTELNRQIDLILESNKDEYSDLWEHPKITSETNFYICDKRLVVFFQPYELSYYARGFIEFPIKLADLEGYLKDEYKRLI